MGLSASVRQEIYTMPVSLGINPMPSLMCYLKKKKKLVSSSSSTALEELFVHLHAEGNEEKWQLGTISLLCEEKEMSQESQGGKCHQRKDHNNDVPPKKIPLFSIFPGNFTIHAIPIIFYPCISSCYILYSIIFYSYRNIPT